jgi:methionyl-tRNA formyltransferase
LAKVAADLRQKYVKIQTMDSSPVTRIIFMGTPDFAVPSLRLLCEESAANNWEVVAVFTQPDRRAGRGKKLVVSPVKAYAMEQGLPVLQPASLRKQPGVVEAIRNLAPDLFVVAAYGLILPVDVLAIPVFGAVNVHSSLLPSYRGASPITAALLDGLTETGNSIMLMDKGMDTGPVLAQVRLSIHPDDTTETLSARLADLGAQALVETLPGWLAGDIAPIPQDQLPGPASNCRLISKQDGAIKWTLPAIEIERMTRAYAPWPSAHTLWNDAVFKILRAEVIEGSAQPGSIVQMTNGVAVGTDAGLLLLQTVQPAGKRAMDIRSFLNGAPGFVGSCFPSSQG